MAIKADCHLHSHFSGDSHTPMEDMILKGISLGLDTMCFTEHEDMDYPDSPDGSGEIFLLNADSYLYELASLKEKYAGQIRILFGLELGLQPHLVSENLKFSRAHEYDFIIGSTHICNGKDPYYPSFFEGRSIEDACREYFESTLTNLKRFSNFDVYGHLDYHLRYAPNLDRDFSYDKYKDILDKILETLLEKEKGIELNTGGMKKGMKDFHPCKDVLKRYRELGGEIITIGSDSHDTDHIADHFDMACEVLTDCGFRYYTVFEKRYPEYISLGQK